MASDQQARAEIAKLIKKFEADRDRQQSEADVKANYIDLLFQALGWNVYNDPGETTNYRREGYVRGAGYVDVGLEIRRQPHLFLEAKRFGLIPASSQRTGDRSLEEKQAFRYARGKGIRYAILTNFERLHLFNADHERLIFAFDSPQQYLDTFEELWRLSPEEVESGSLAWWEGQLEKKDIDLEFLTALRRWRLQLAQAIYDQNTESPALRRNGSFDFDLLMAAVQRMLDRLILIRYGDDKEVLISHDLLEKMLAHYQGLGGYAHADHLTRAFVDLSHSMDEHHNTTLFAPGHVCEQVTVPNQVLAEVVDQMNRISFRKFTSDILGNTYESYLGTKLVLRNGQIGEEERRDIRKGRGIYYTPRWVVEYIVDNTLGRRLKELEQEHGLRAIEKVRGLSVLDPACGSGSFLIYAYQVLADFYRRLNEAIAREQARMLAEAAQFRLFETLDEIKGLPQPVLDYPQVILKDHLFGVDLDPEAAEIAAVNLTMQAFADSRQKKLPLILNENIKVGNSLISGREEELRKYFGDNWQEKRPFKWETEFPELMARGGFDVVVGNPPYVRVDTLPEPEKRLWKDRFASAVGKYDIYYLFLELATRLLSDKGSFGFITPNRYCTNSTGENLRKLIQKATGDLTVTSLSRIPVFSQAAVYPVVTILRQGTDSGAGRLTVYDVAQPEELVSAAPSYQLVRSEMRVLPRAIVPIGVRGEDLALAIRMLKAGEPAGRLINIQEGLRIPQPWESETQATGAEPPIIKQYQFCRYSVVSQKTYLPKERLSSLGSGRSERMKNSSKPKLLFAEDALTIEATLDETGGLCQGGVYFATQKPDCLYSLKYLLGLYNSRLLSFVFGSLYRGIHMGGGYLRFRTQYLEELPIRRINLDDPADKRLHDAIVEAVEEMVALQRRMGPVRHTACAERDDLQRQIDRVDRHIDELVYELYGLTEEEVALVEHAAKA